MNQFALTVIWLILQISLLGVLTAFIYALARRGNPMAGAATLLTGMLLIAFLSVTAFCPWPEWSMEEFAQSWNRSSPPSRSVSNNATITDRPSGQPVQPNASEGESTIQWSIGSFASWWSGLQTDPSVDATRTTHSSAHKFSWIAWLVICVPIGASIGLIRLIVGLVSIRSDRRNSQTISDKSLQETVEVLRAEFECRQQIELRESAQIASPATIGWRNPIILLPTNWRDWTEQEQRSVLAHEIVHNDFAYWLAAQAGLLLHFYHPLVHWLASRLRLEQELAADAAAARYSGGSQSYLTTLAELALRQDDRPVPWPARTFIPTRGTLMRRIEMLRNSRKQLTHPSTWRRSVVISLVAMLGVFVAGLRQPSAESVQAQDTPPPARNSSPTIQLAQAGDSDSVQSTNEFDLRYVPPTSTLLIGIRPTSVPEDDTTKTMLATINQMSTQAKVGVERFGYSASALSRI